MFWVFWKHYIESEAAGFSGARPSAKNQVSARYKVPAAAKPKAAAEASTFGGDVYCVLDSQLDCLSLSPNWQGLSGFPAEEDLQDGLKSRIAPDHIRKLSHYLSQGRANAAPVRFQIKHASGHWHWCELQMKHAIAGADGANTRYECLLRDVTELMATQAKLQKAKLEADLATKSRSEFLANMSHELRTPLNAILGFAQMMENGTYGELGHPKYHDYIGNIQESGATLLSRINDLLEIANIDSGRMELNEAPADLAQIIRQAIEFHSHHAFSNEITLQHRLPPEPLLAVVDRIRMLQVLTNVLSNAIKFNRPGGTVDMRCERRRDGGLNIVVEDNGGGIAASQLENILSAFRQDNSFFARSRDCVGLGLALSKEIVKLHQGRITIESEPGKGTLLTIRLPAERTVKAPLEEKTLESFLLTPVD